MDEIFDQLEAYSADEKSLFLRWEKQNPSMERENPLLWRAKSTCVFMEDHYDYTEGHSLYIYIHLSRHEEE